jgi:hypothetical protein
LSSPCDGAAAAEDEEADRMRGRVVCDDVCGPAPSCSESKGPALRAEAAFDCWRSAAVEQAKEETEWVSDAEGRFCDRSR